VIGLHLIRSFGGYVVFLLAGTSAPSDSTVLTVSADCMVLRGIAVTVYQTELMQVLVENLYGPKSLFTICS